MGYNPGSRSVLNELDKDREHGVKKCRHILDHIWIIFFTEDSEKGGRKKSHKVVLEGGREALNQASTEFDRP